MIRQVRRSEAVVVGGFEAAEWLRMYDNTHHQGQRIEWPEGGVYMQQLVLVVEVWELLSEVLRQYRKQMEDKKNGKRN